MAETCYKTLYAQTQIILISLSLVDQPLKKGRGNMMAFKLKTKIPSGSQSIAQNNLSSYPHEQ